MSVCLEDLVATTPEVATLPETVIAVLEVLDDLTAGVDRLIPIVERDPGLTANLLKLCNSSLYGTWRQIGSVREALARVGNVNFMKLVLTLGMEQVIRCDLPGYQLSLDELWRHSLMVAYGSYRLMRGTRLAHLRVRSYTAGLLHDIGKMVLDKEMVRGGGTEHGAGAGDELARERALVGFDHAQAGSMLLDKWTLPAEICEAVRQHHAPEPHGDHAEIALAVFAGNAIVHLPSVNLGVIEPVDSKAMDDLARLGIARETVQSLCEVFKDKRDDLLSLILEEK
jgi:putative nucleotidyltransferase with HDIG domain